MKGSVGDVWVTLSELDQFITENLDLLHFK